MLRRDINIYRSIYGVLFLFLTNISIIACAAFSAQRAAVVYRDSTNYECTFDYLFVYFDPIINNNACNIFVRYYRHSVILKEDAEVKTKDKINRVVRINISCAVKMNNK